MTERKENLISGILQSDFDGTKDNIKLLNHIGFEEPAAAAASLARIPRNEAERNAFVPLLTRLLDLLTDVAHPDQVVLNFEKLSHATPDAALLFHNLMQEPRLLEALVALFAGSQFLTEVLLRDPAQLLEMEKLRALSRFRSRQELHSAVSDAVDPDNSLFENLNALRRFQRHELLRIGTGDLIGTVSFEHVVNQLSNLARAIIRLSLELIAREMQIPLEGFAVFALGKLGGRELNYSSDVDLLFVAKTPHEAHKKLGQQLITGLSEVSTEGFLYRVDMRLRPWGKTGTLVPGYEENLTYLEKHAQIWEKQAMYKCRRMAGDDVMAIAFLDEVRKLIMDLPRDELRDEIIKMKGKIEANLRKKGTTWGEVKGGAGSIRDVEFITQYLQLSHARSHPEIQSRNTLDGLARLMAADLLAKSDYRVLADGYVFLRTIEHHLQIMHYRQMHQLPDDTRALTFLARRLGFQGERVGEEIVERYREHSAAIRQIFDHFFAAPTPKPVVPTAASADVTSANSHTARMDASYALTFQPAQIETHRQMAESITVSEPVRLAVEPIQENVWQVTIVALDALGVLSLICGLFVVYRVDIIDGSIFTYEPDAVNPSPKPGVKDPRLASRRKFRPGAKPDARRKIVDVFRVRTVETKFDMETWGRYELELSERLSQVRAGKQREVQGEVSKRVALIMSKQKGEVDALLPVDIAVDNSSSERYTILRIDAPDTIGFLFQFTNALALNGVSIARVRVNSVGHRLHDTVYISDLHGNKITDPQKLYQLRAATVLVKHFTHLLPHSPNPESAILNFTGFISSLFLQTDWSQELTSLERPEVLETLSKLLGVSEFLWNDFLRMQHANLFPLVADAKRLAAEKSTYQLNAELQQELKRTKNRDQQIEILNRFKDREMFRIDMRYILEVNPELSRFSAELSDLADTVIEQAYRLCRRWFEPEFGRPKRSDGRTCGFCIGALGKLGGREIGFASDIELIFIYEDDGQTSGPDKITNDQFFLKIVNEMRRIIQSRTEGIFDLDLRMRPYGKSGSLVVPVSLVKSYYAEEGAAWDYERQALVKLRPIAGNIIFRRQVLDLVESIIYTDKPFAVSSMRAMRERQIRQLVAGGTINAKLSPGGLVDLEYLVQGLQLTNGKQFPDLRLTNTAQALQVLKQHQIISAEDYDFLAQAHDFLRKLIEALRMVRGNARDLAVPKPESDAFDFLARRMKYDDNQKLFDDLLHHTATVQDLSERMLG